MGDFFSMLFPVLQGAGTLMSAFGALQQGRSQEQAGLYNATIAAENAAIARQDAEAQARQSAREGALRLGAIRAAQAKSGGAAGEGSVLDVLADVAAQNELEKQDILYRGDLAARGYANTAYLDRMSASNARRGAYLRAGSELLSGGAGAYSMYNRLIRT